LGASYITVHDGLKIPNVEPFLTVLIVLSPQQLLYHISALSTRYEAKSCKKEVPEIPCKKNLDFLKSAAIIGTTIQSTLETDEAEIKPWSALQRAGGSWKPRRKRRGKWTAEGKAKGDIARWPDRRPALKARDVLASR